MKVKVNGKVYDSKDTMIALYLEHKDKENIINMHPDCVVYTEFPDSMDLNVVEKEITKAREEMEESK